MRDQRSFLFAEGVAMIVLEELNAAVQRGAVILGEIFPTDSGMSPFDWHNEEEQGMGIQLAMQGALKRSETKPDEVDFICAHANSSPLTDKIETNAIKNVFGEHSKNPYRN